MEGSIRQGACVPRLRPGLLHFFPHRECKSHRRAPRIVQVTQDARAEVPAADALAEGGDSPSEQRCTFLELALALAGSLDAAAISMLYKALKPALQVRPCPPAPCNAADSPTVPIMHISMACMPGCPKSILKALWRCAAD